MMKPPPTGTEVMPDFAENLFTVVTGVPMVVVGCIALYLAIRKREPLLLFCFIGGAFASLIEPIADVLACLYFPAVNQETAFTALGRPIPWALVFAYPWFVGGQGYLTYRMLEKGVSAQRLWMLWLLFILSNIAVETPGVLTGFHVYYNNQPFNYWGFPLWMAFYQSIMPLAAGTLIYLAKKYIGDGWKMLVVIPLMPMADALVNAALAFPVYLTIGSGASLTVNYIAALTTLGLSAIAIWMLTLVFAQKK